MFSKRFARWGSFLFLSSFFILSSCGDSNQIDWPSDFEKKPLLIKDLSAPLYLSNRPISQLRKENPLFYSDQVSDEVYQSIRTDSTLKSIYQEVNNLLKETTDLPDEMGEAFGRTKYFFPNWQPPLVFVYSSDLNDLYNPITYSLSGDVFIALDAFLGRESVWYEIVQPPVFNYVKEGMNPENILPKLVEAIGKEIIPSTERNDFLGKMILEGKYLILKDALLPKVQDSLKIGYTEAELEWCKIHEYAIWNYFIESDYLFSSDKELEKRFLDVGPFSKFYSDIQQDSPGRVGAWIGWQILRKYHQEKPEVSLKEILLETDAREIFKTSGYKPKR